MIRWVQQLACLLSLPPTLAHEATHYAVARSQTDDAALVVEVLDSRAQASWAPIDNSFWRVFAFLAPTVFGSVLALTWALSGIDVDGWRLIFAVGLALYAAPSPADISGALGRQDAQINSRD